jgi:hypothetical protein
MATKQRAASSCADVGESRMPPEPRPGGAARPPCTVQLAGGGRSMYLPMLHHQLDWWSLSLHDGLHNANVAF